MTSARKTATQIPHTECLVFRAYPPSYTLYSFFLVQITDFYVNEGNGGVWYSDYTGEDWETPPEDSSTTISSGTLADLMCAADQNNPLSVDPRSPLLTVEVEHASQNWYVGSLSYGSGIQVQSDTFQLYQDHGRHNSTMSPVR